MNFFVGSTLLIYLTNNILNSIALNTAGCFYNSLVFVKKGAESYKIIEYTKTQISKLDIKVKLELVSALMDNLPENKITKTIENGLIELIFKINSIINWIDYEIIKHQEKWFSSYRKLSFDEKITF